MILHLVHDDKVVPRMISQFEEVCPGNNIYICVSGYKSKSELKFLKDNPHVILSQTKEVSRIPWKSIDKVCFHYLTFKKIRYYCKLCVMHNIKNPQIIWFMWGGDIYDVLERRGLKMYSDNNSFYNALNKNSGYARSIKGLMELRIQKMRCFLSDFFKCYFFDKKFDYVVCNSKEEFDLFCKYVKFSKCKKLLHYHYYPIEDTLGKLKDVVAHGHSIIIGNSASPSNNHEYILQHLKGIQLGERKVYVPLSYARNEKYVKNVKEKYTVLSNVVMIDDFLPLEDYYHLLSECSTFIYGHFRQEAWGNILVALYLGGKVYVSKKSIFPSYLESMGFVYFITEDIEKTFYKNLTKEEIDNNRNIAMMNYSRDINRKNIELICNL